MTATREELWIALSDLWLDTDLSEAELRRMAQVVRSSGLDRDDLERVFSLELAPVLGPNHLSVAGEWGSFDPTWVCAEARARQANPRLRDRLAAALGITTYAARPYWTRVLELAFGEGEL